MTAFMGLAGNNAQLSPPVNPKEIYNIYTYIWILTKPTIRPYIYILYICNGGEASMYRYLKICMYTQDVHNYLTEDCSNTQLEMVIDRDIRHMYI